MYNKTIQVLSSKYFFIFILVLFAAQALWIAFSFRYSMIYDEYYHFGLIEYFSHQWLPWISNQSKELDIYGALERQPHLLFHYILSFPFKIVSLFTENLAAQVIFMRVLNIALFLTGLVLFNKLFKKMDIKPIFRNISLLLFVLLPAVPFVAATVNYDNAMFPLIALFMLVGIKIIKNKSVDWRQYIWLILVGLVGVLVKSAFIPIFFAGAAFIFIWTWRNKGKKFFNELIRSFRKSSVAMKMMVLLPVIIVGVLFTERFGVNVVQYHSLSPSCTRQISAERCKQNFVGLREQELEATKSQRNPVQAPDYVVNWAKEMVRTLFISGANLNVQYGTTTSAPLPVVYNLIFWTSIIAILAMAYSFNLIKRVPGLWFIVPVISLYLAALFYVNVTSYYTYYEPVAIQGRYLLPILPMVMLFSLLSINYILKDKRNLKLPLLIIFLLFYLNGAGVITHIVRSDESWNWENTKIRKVNNSARDLLRPFTKEWWYER